MSRRAIIVAFAATLAALPMQGSAAAQRSDTTILRASPPLHPRVGTLVEELRLGEGSDATEFQFTDVQAIAGRQGSVYVIDAPEAFSSSVRQYDRSGKFVRAIGRNGQGPGEYYAMAGDVKELPDGRILVSDGRGVLVYSADGAPFGRWTARYGAANVGSPILVDPSGFVYTYGSRRTGERATRPGPQPSVPILYRFRFDGQLVDTVDAPMAAFPNPARMDRVNIPFIPRYHAAWSPRGYFVTSHAATYAVDLRRPRIAGGMWRPGDPVISIRRTVTPVPVQDAGRNDWQQSLTMFMRSGGSTPNWQWNGPEIPRVKPPISGLMVAEDGRIWVQLHQPARLIPSITIRTRPATREESYGIDARYRWVEPLAYDVFEPTGQYVGQVRFPDVVIRASVQGDTIWAVAKDADDVQTVRRYRIEWRR